MKDFGSARCPWATPLSDSQRLAPLHYSFIENVVQYFGSKSAMHLLIVEDDKDLAKTLKKTLAQRGFAVDVLHDAEKALTRISMYRNEYALVVLDLGLPKMDGHTLTKTLRTEGITTPIIVLSGKAEPRHKIELLNSGADDYLAKPFSAEELIARINTVLRRPKEARKPIERVGSLEIDTAARRVRLGGRDVQLTLKEFSLLECFVRQPGTVISREELTNQVWDFNAVAWSNILDVHMKNLRRKLGESDARLETVRGVGYRLVI